LLLADSTKIIARADEMASMISLKPPAASQDATRNYNIAGVRG
jgi:hypothetical protein